MKVRRMHATLNPLLRWRWDAAGVFGYSATKRGALKAARDAIAQARAYDEAWTPSRHL
jgi:hypothetical protein